MIFKTHINFMHLIILNMIKGKQKNWNEEICLRNLVIPLYLIGILQWQFTKTALLRKMTNSHTREVFFCKKCLELSVKNLFFLCKFCAYLEIMPNYSRKWLSKFCIRVALCLLWVLSKNLLHRHLQKKDLKMGLNLLLKKDLKPY